MTGRYAALLSSIPGSPAGFNGIFLYSREVEFTWVHFGIYLSATDIDFTWVTLTLPYRHLHWDITYVSMILTLPKGH